MQCTFHLVGPPQKTAKQYFLLNSFMKFGPRFEEQVAQETNTDELVLPPCDINILFTCTVGVAIE